MIRGIHAMFYSAQADALRAFLRGKIGLAGQDVGDGLILQSKQPLPLKPAGLSRSR